jgi:hypothetical protein
VAKAAVLTVTLLTLIGGFGTKSANASQMLPKHHKISQLPLRVQMKWYQKNITHAKNTLHWWKDRGKEFLSPNHKAKGYIQRRDIRYHQRLLANATRNLQAVERRIKLLSIPSYLRSYPAHINAWLCIHRYEGSWTDTGAPYYGGLQMDWGFMSSYGGWLLVRKGPANNWTPMEQMQVAERAYQSGRGFYPWPNTARYCGLL